MKSATSRLAAMAAPTVATIFVAVGLVAGCSTTPPGPEPFYASPIIEVASGEIPRYWVPAKTRFTFQPRHLPSRSQPCSFVELEYTIDSNGNAFDWEVLESWPNDAFAEDSIRLISMQRYLPAEGNPDRIPIRTRTTQEFRMRGVDCETLRAEAGNAG